MLDLPPPDPGIEIAISSRGVSKGLAQTDGPQIVVRPEIAFGPLFVSAYAKNVTSADLDGEAGGAVGYRTSIGGFELSASAAYKRSIDPAAGVDDEAFELTATGSRRWGPVTVRATAIWSPDDLGSTGRSVFAEGGVSYAIGDGTAASANYGRRARDGGADYGAWNIGLSRTLVPGVSAELRWFDTDRGGLGEAFHARLVGSLRLRF